MVPVRLPLDRQAKAATAVPASPSTLGRAGQPATPLGSFPAAAAANAAASPSVGPAVGGGSGGSLLASPTLPRTSPRTGLRGSPSPGRPSRASAGMTPKTAGSRVSLGRSAGGASARSTPGGHASSVRASPNGDVGAFEFPGDDPEPGHGAGADRDDDNQDASGGSALVAGEDEEPAGPGGSGDEGEPGGASGSGVGVATPVPASSGTKGKLSASGRKSGRSTGRSPSRVRGWAGLPCVCESPSHHPLPTHSLLLGGFAWHASCRGLHGKPSHAIPRLGGKGGNK